MKFLKKSLSILLSVAMTASIATAAASADGEGTPASETVTIQSWSAANLNDLKGSGLTTDLEGKLSSSNRLLSIGNKGYGIWAYLSPSVGNYLDVTAGHKYVCEAQVWVEDYITPDPSSIDWTDNVDNWFNADCWVYSPVDKTFTSTPLTREMYEAAPVSYDETYGYPYKSIQMTIEIPDKVQDGNETIIPSGSSEFRFYTNGFTNFKHYKMLVYDETADPFLASPVLNMDASLSNPYNVPQHLADPEHYVECDNLFLNPGIYLSVGNTQDCVESVFVGNAGKTLPAGNYTFEYALDYTFIRPDCVTLSVEITKNGEHYAGETFTDDTLPADGIISVPLVADEEADYRAALIVGNNASLTLKSIELKQTVDASVFDDVVAKINAIGEVKYDPDNSEDSGELIKAARDAYDALEKTYGDLSDKISNYQTLTDAESTYANLKDQYDVMLENAATVDEAINVIPLPVSDETKTAFELADDLLASFIDSYGEEKAKLHIKGLEKLEEIREMLNTKAVPGDVDGDNDVTVTDALMVLQHSVSKITLSDAAVKNADVDGDESITVTDALLILQYAVKQIDSFPGFPAKL